MPCDLFLFGREKHRRGVSTFQRRFRRTDCRHLVVLFTAVMAYSERASALSASSVVEPRGLEVATAGIWHGGVYVRAWLRSPPPYPWVSLQMQPPNPRHILLLLCLNAENLGSLYFLFANAATEPTPHPSFVISQGTLLILWTTRSVYKPMWLAIMERGGTI